MGETKKRAEDAKNQIVAEARKEVENIFAKSEKDIEQMKGIVAEPLRALCEDILGTHPAKRREKAVPAGSGPGAGLRAARRR